MMRGRVSAPPPAVRRSSMAMSRPSLPRILHPEIGPAHQVAVEQGLARALGHDAAGLEHVAALGGGQGGGHVLLDEQHGQTLLAVEHLQHVQDRVHDARHDAEARLVEHKEARPRHERARDREHLALPAGERARALIDALAQHREEAEDPLEHLLAALRVAVAEGAEAQVLGHREAAEEAPALGDERDAEVDPVRGLDVVDAAAVEPDPPAHPGEQARAGPVRPDMASSSRSRRGAVASARVISSRFLSARVRAAATTSSLPARPVKASSSSARARAGPIRLVRRSAPQITFSSTVMRPKLRTTCQVRAMPSRHTRSGLAREMSVPSSTIRPSSGWSEPLMQLNSVVLPAPLGPMSPTISRGSMVSETSRFATRPPKRLVHRSICSRGATAISPSPTL